MFISAYNPVYSQLLWESQGNHLKLDTSRHPVNGREEWLNGYSRACQQLCFSTLTQFRIS